MLIENNINRAYNNPTKEDIKRINKDITYILNKAWKKIEGSKWLIPYSKQKELRRAAMLYWSSYVKFKQNKLIDQNAMAKRKIIARINDENITIDEAQEKLKEAIK